MNHLNKSANISNSIMKKDFSLQVLNEDFYSPVSQSLKTQKMRGISDVDTIPTARHSSISLEDSTVWDPVPVTIRLSKDLKISNENVKIVDKSKWIDDEKCYVCERGFDKLRLINPHHCRVCAHGVCGDCSIGRVNDQRACDICMKREVKKDDEKRRQGRLVYLDEKTMRTQRKFESLITEAYKMKGDVEKYKEETKKLEDNRDKIKRNHEQEKEQCLDALQELKEKNFKLRLDIKDEDKKVLKKESRLENLRLQMAALRLEINQKEAIYAEKKEIFNKTKSKLDSLKEDVKQSEPVPTSYKDWDNKAASMPGRKFTLLNSDQQNRKYSVSNKPHFF